MKLTFLTHRYKDQTPHRPAKGQHIMAQYDDDSIIVYQAYRPAIASFAVEHQRFGGEFSYSRMSWIKPNFLWMMFRAGWATKEGQERILAIRLQRAFFDELLTQCVPSTFDPARFRSHDAWKAAVRSSDVRLQWDPDHDPNGRALERRAVQLGLRGEALRRYGREALVSIEDITPFVLEQRGNLSPEFERLLVPAERIYRPTSKEAAKAVGIDG